MKRTILLTLAFILATMPVYASNPPSDKGALFITLTSIGGTVGQGALRLFSGGPDTVSSSVIVAGAVLTAYSNLPHVKRNFRERIAEKRFGIANAAELSDYELLTAIRDDGTKPFYTALWEESLNIPKPTNGGRLRARILGWQN